MGNVVKNKPLRDFSIWDRYDAPGKLFSFDLELTAHVVVVDGAELVEPEHPRDVDDDVQAGVGAPEGPGSTKRPCRP